MTDHIKEQISDLFEAQRGFAMVLALLITVIMTLLGVAFLLMAETENRIAQNERRAAQAMYFAEAGVRLAESWFNSDYPNGALFPPVNPGAVDLSLRLIDDDGDPATSPHLQNGSAWPRYKQGVDLNFDGDDDLFLRPYRGDLTHTLLGTLDGPDIRIDGTPSGSAAARAYLDAMSESLMPGYPGAGAAVRARISRIDIYAPPYVELNGAWTRHGLATIGVEAAIYRDMGGTDQVLARRTVTAVLHEIPYYSARGPLQSGGNVSFNGNLTVHWGPMIAAGQSDLDDEDPPTRLPESHPRAFPGGINVDLVWAYNDDAMFQSYKDTTEGKPIEDPWFRYFSAGPIVDAPTASVQPWPFEWDPPDPVANEPRADDHSEFFHNLPMGAFPNFDYDMWKRIATSRHSGVYYYVWVEGSSFSENGTGPELTFREITDNREGVFFFDTRDKRKPYDDDGDGQFDNLTPKLVVNGGTWSTKGLIYLNADSFQAGLITGRPTVFNPPGEVFQDKDQNGEHDPGENWFNLEYQANIFQPPRVREDDGLQDDGTMGVVMRNRIGPDITANASLWGILYNSGRFDVSGAATLYGSIIAEGGIEQSNPGGATSHLFWDDRIPTEWPPPTLEVPRVAVVSWDTE